MFYYVASSNELLVITGFGIEDFMLRKKALVWPLQKCSRFSFTPLNYELTIHALSHEKLAISIQASLTIGPHIEGGEELKKYVRLLVNGDNQAKQEQTIRDRISGIIEGEVRAVAASMPIEDLFNNRKHFQGKVMEYIQEALNKFGCILYNANVEELKDSAGYFSTVGQRAQEGAISAAKVAIAESKMKGDVGAQECITRSQKETARLKAETQVFENERAQIVAESKANLNVKETTCNAQVQIAQIEGQKAAALREAELQQEVEKKRALVEVERLRADEYAKAVVEAEKIKELANAKAFEKQKLAEAALYEMQKQAEANLYLKQKEAEGVQQMYSAQATGLRDLIKAFDNSKTALQYLMLEKGVYQKLAAENARAIQGLQPKFNIWTSGAAQSDSGKPLREIFNSLPPLLSTIQQQTGLEAPEWMNSIKNATNPAA